MATRSHFSYIVLEPSYSILQAFQIITQLPHLNAVHSSDLEGIGAGWPQSGLGGQEGSHFPSNAWDTMARSARR